MTRIRNRLRFIRRTIYRLKRQYGLPVDLYSQTLGATNLETGAKSSTLDKVVIKRAIVQPARNHRDFVYDLAYISANKDFTTGGFFDASDRRIIIDARDLPSSWVMDADQFVIYNNQRYDIKSFYEFEEGMGYILVVRATIGQKIHRLEEPVSIVRLRQTAVGIV